MANRCAIVGVFGGELQAEDAYALGGALARYDVAILTGGVPEPTGEVKNEVPRGAADVAEGSGPGVRLIGVLPSTQRRWIRPNSRWLWIETGLTHIERDAVNGLTPDAVIAFRGSSGTLCELAYAAVSGIPVTFFDCVDHLREKYAQRSQDGELATYFDAASRVYPSFPVVFLRDSLETLLKKATDATRDVGLVARAASSAAQAALSESSRFPGIPFGDADSLRTFNAILVDWRSTDQAL